MSVRAATTVAVDGGVCNLCNVHLRLFAVISTGNR